MKNCELCEREVYSTSRHHLIPRTLHTNKWFKKNFTRDQMMETVDLCRPCHKQIHQLITEKEMGRSFYTLDRLKTNEQVAKFLKWLVKQKV